jgi:hypothetical protein
VHHSHGRQRARAAWLTLIAVSLGGCINVFWETVPRRVQPPSSGSPPVVVFTPLKVHLTDGSTVLFRTGAAIDSKTIEGDGQRYPALSVGVQPQRRVPLDSVVGVETFEGKMLTAKTVIVSTAASVFGSIGTVGLLKVIFGSCPTVYTDTGAGPMLQAEGFSYAIAPLLEQRDIDPVHLRSDRDGVLRMDLRNEALETHFINHIELLAVDHRVGSRVVPDNAGGIVELSDIRPLDAARDRAGRDVRVTLANADGHLFETEARTTSASRVGDLDDWIDLDARGLPPGDSIAVVLRLRNSLLNTVLLYEGVLGGRDAPDFMERGLQRISTAIDLSRWYTRTMGMRAIVDGVPTRLDAWHARLGDIGPLAFRDVAILLPRPARNADSVRVRLRFVADNWRIDYVAIAGTVTRPNVNVVPITRVVIPTPADGAGPKVDTAGAMAVRESDAQYLETRPGQRMMLEFNSSSASPSAGQERSYLIAWQGYYREWIRGSWLANPTRTTAWIPGDDAVLVAMRRWQSRQAELERAFYSSRIPVR